MSLPLICRIGSEMIDFVSHLFFLGFTIPIAFPLSFYRHRRAGETTRATDHTRGTRAAQTPSQHFHPFPNKTRHRLYRLVVHPLLSEHPVLTLSNSDLPLSWLDLSDCP
uniref:Uncharacterized protein n=1 Tax=Cacopsylla melanoneura TaxID=428564 RepID=A0A8D9BN53_9HEMI